MRRLLPALALLAIAGCASTTPAEIQAYPEKDGLLVRVEEDWVRLKLPAFAWEKAGRPKVPPRPPAAPLGTDRAVEACGFRFVCGNGLWIVEAAGRRELPLPDDLLARRAWRRGREDVTGCCGGCTAILGGLFGPAGPDPGLSALGDKTR